MATKNADGRHGDHDAGRHDHAPVHDGGIEEIVDADGQRLQLLGGDQHEGEEEVVPRQDEREDGGRDEAGQRQRQHHVPHRLAAMGAVDERCLLQLERNALEEGAQEPEAEGQTERRVREHERQPRVRDPELLHQDVEGDDDHDGREHVGEEDQAGHLARGPRR